MKDQLNNLPFLKKKGKAASEADADEQAEELQKELAEENGEEISEEVPDAKAASNVPAWKRALAKQVPSLAKLLKIDADAEPSSSDATDTNLRVKPVDAAAKRKQLIIRGVIGLGVAMLALELIFPSEDEAVTEAPPAEVAPKPKKKRRPRPGDAPAVATDTPATTDGTTPSTDTTTLPPLPPQDGVPPTADVTSPPATDGTGAVTPDVPVVTDTPVDAPITTDSPVVTDTPPVTDTPVDVTPPDPVVDAPVVTDTPVVTDAPTDAPTDRPTDAPTDTPTDTPPADPVTGGEGTVGDQVVDGTVATGDGDMTDKILEDLEKQLKDNQPAKLPVVKEYVRPPGYEYPGRGLVYNCRGKHWACLDAGSYAICQQNYGYLKDQGKAKECYPDSVYETDRACGWVQRTKISGNAKTDFCE